MPGKFDINPSTGRQYGENPATGQSDDNYWATVVEPQLKRDFPDPAPIITSPTQPASQLNSPEDVTNYLNSFQNTVFSNQNAPAIRMPEKGDINPDTGKAYAVNPSTGNWDDNYWSGVVEPRLKAQSGGGRTSGGLPTFEQVQGELKLSAGQRPAVISRADERIKQRTDLKVADLESSLVDLKAQEQTAIATLRLRTKAEQGKPVPLGVISGRVSEIERQERENLDFIQRQKSRVVDELQMKYAVINQNIQDLGLDYGDAVAKYDSEFDQSIKMIELVRGIKKDQLDEQQRQRVNAQANLQLYVNSIQSGNLDYSSMGGDQKVMISKLEAQAGLPIGFVSGLQMNAKDKLLGFSEDKTQAFVVGSDGKFNVIQTGMRAEPKEGKLTDAKAAREQFNSASINDNFPDLVNRFANTMSLDEIYKAYSNTAKGKKYGTPNENTREINFLYKVAKGEMTPEEARSKLEE